MNEDDISLAFVSRNLKKQKEQSYEEDYEYGEEYRYEYEYDEFEDDEFLEEYQQSPKRQTLDDEFNNYNETHSQKYEGYDNNEYDCYYDENDEYDEGFDYEYDFESDGIYDIEDDFFNNSLIPAFPFYPAFPAHYRRQNSKNALERRMMDFSPKINLSEDENNYYIHADLPGMNKDQVKMEITDDHTFTISGERESIKDSDKDDKAKEGETKETKKAEKKNKKYHRVECSYGKFERSFSIPENVDLNNIQAKMENGVLEVTFKKAEPPKNQKRTIQIQ